MPPLLTRSPRRVRQVPGREVPAPPLAPMAPIAVDPGVVRAASPIQRQRWIVAATVAGVMLTSQAVQRQDGDAAQPGGGSAGLAGVELASVDVDLTSADVDLTSAEVAPSTGDVGPSTGDVDLASAPFVGSADQPLGGGMPHPLPPEGVVVATPAVVAATTPTAAEGATPEPEPESEGTGALPDGPAEIARYGDIRLVAEGSGVELVGFHESSNAGALTLSTPDLSEEGPVIELPTRNRPSSPTSAVDVAMAPDAPVTAPVDGEVLSVGDYTLYGSTPDTIIQIRPDADPDVVVTVVHVAEPTVAAGDRVVAGETAIAGEALQLPFDSQIDRFTTAHRGQAAPHIHIELAALTRT